MNEEYFENMYNYCKSKHNHLLIKHIHDEPGSTVWAKNAHGHCSRCLCHFYETIIDSVHYNFWVNPSNKKILDVSVIPLEYNEEEQRFRLRKEI